MNANSVNAAQSNSIRPRLMDFPNPWTASLREGTQHSRLCVSQEIYFWDCFVG